MKKEKQPDLKRIRFLRKKYGKILVLSVSWLIVYVLLYIAFLLITRFLSSELYYFDFYGLAMTLLGSLGSAFFVIPFIIAIKNEILRNTNKHTEIAVAELRELLKRQEDKRKMDESNDKIFENVVREQEQDAFKKYLSELSGDSMMYHYLSRVQHDHASMLTLQKKYNDALIAQDLSEELYRIAYFLEKKPFENDNGEKNNETPPDFVAETGSGPIVFSNHLSHN